MPFGPDAIFFVATGREQDRSAFYLAEVIRKGIEIPYPELQEIVERSGAECPGMDETTATKPLLPFGGEILAAIYRRIASKAREQGIVPVWIFLPQVRQGTWQDATPERSKSRGRRASSSSTWRMCTTDRISKSIRLAEWDEHPNASGTGWSRSACTRTGCTTKRRVFPTQLSGATVMSDSIKDQVKNFILETFLPGEDPEELTARRRSSPAASSTRSPP